ncbi:MAG: hypothetical protein R3F37_10320 [Candidatus Competibacteraceae bacterium]
MQHCVDKETFREDLFYRLNGLILEMPPLRQAQRSGLLIDQLLTAESAGQFIALDKAARAAGSLSLARQHSSTAQCVAYRRGPFARAIRFGWLICHHRSSFRQ